MHRILRTFALLLVASTAALAQGTTTTKKADTKATTKAATTAPAADASKSAPMDLNTATKEQLMTLAGIGDKISDKIIAGRPWRAKNDLVAKKVLTQAAYDKIKDQIIAKQAK